MGAMKPFGYDVTVAGVPVVEMVGTGAVRIPEPIAVRLRAAAGVAERTCPAPMVPGGVGPKPVTACGEVLRKFMNEQQREEAWECAPAKLRPDQR
jgi:hypothetical protein